MQLPYSAPFPGTSDEPNLFGVALLAGRVTGTIVGSTGHITINATCKAKGDSGRWKQVQYSEAFAVYLTVPGAEGEWADKVATFYPPHSSSKWAGHFFTDREQTDDRRVKAARYLLDAAFGENAGTHVLLADRCLRCSREITHPDSIGSGFGPECIKIVGGFMPNRSGTPEGAHVPKDKDAAKPADVEPIEAAERAAYGTHNVDSVVAEVLADLSDDELDRAMVKATERDDQRRLALYADERGRRNRARDEADGTAPRSNAEFVPPTPDVDAAAPVVTREVDEKGLRFVLTAGDDPAAVLARASAPAAADFGYDAWRRSPEGEDAYADMRQEALDAARDER